MTAKVTRSRNERDWPSSRASDQEDGPEERCGVCEVDLFVDRRPAFYWARGECMIHDHCWNQYHRYMARIRSQVTPS